MIDTCPSCMRPFIDGPLSADEASKTAEQLRMERDAWRSEFQETCTSRMEFFQRMLRAESLLVEAKMYVECAAAQSRSDLHELNTQGYVTPNDDLDKEILAHDEQTARDLFSRIDSCLSKAKNHE